MSDHMKQDAHVKATKSTRKPVCKLVYKPAGRSISSFDLNFKVNF